MKALMQDLGPDFKFPEWKCAQESCLETADIRVDFLPAKNLLDLDILKETTVDFLEQKTRVFGSIERKSIFQHVFSSDKLVYRIILFSLVFLSVHDFRKHVAATVGID